MSHIEQLIGRQIELSEIRRRLDAEHRQPALGQPQPAASGPCVLVSRECGSQGEHLARLVGDRLRWKVFDREILEAVARHAHVRTQLVESIDEPIRSRWRLPKDRDASGEALGRSEYLYHLLQVLLALGHHGSVVLLGRGAHYVLPPDRCVRLRLVAPRDQRIQRVADQEHVPLADAERRVDTIDAERAAFVRVSFNRDLAAAADYDLVLNTGTVPFEPAVEFVTTLVREKLGVDTSRVLACTT